MKKIYFNSLKERDAAIAGDPSVWLASREEVNSILEKKIKCLKQKSITIETAWVKGAIK